MAGRAGAEVGGVTGGLGRGGGPEEDRLGVLGGEGAVGVGHSRLEQQRGALRGRARQVRSLHRVLRAPVADWVHLAVPGGAAVLHERVLVPGAFPELVGDLEVFGGRRAGRIVGGDVPRDPPVAGVVKGGDAPGEVGRMLVRARGGEGDAEMVGHVGDRAGQHRRIVARCLEAALERPVAAAAAGDVVGDCVGQEDGVEPAALQGPARRTQCSRSSKSAWRGRARRQVCWAGRPAALRAKAAKCSGRGRADGTADMGSLLGGAGWSGQVTDTGSWRSGGGRREVGELAPARPSSFPAIPSEVPRRSISTNTTDFTGNLVMLGESPVPVGDVGAEPFIHLPAGQAELVEAVTVSGVTARSRRGG